MSSLRLKLHKMRQQKYLYAFFSLVCVALSAAMQSLTVQMFVRPCNLQSAGFIGIAVLVNNIGNLFGVNISISFVLLCLNIPVALACFKGISPRFTFFSLVQVVLSSFFLNYLHFDPVFEDIILNVVFAGVLNGLAISIALKGNASTGGTDFIALFLSNRNGKTIWHEVFLFNCLLLIIFGAIFGWEHAGYSIIFQYISTKVVSTFHKRYQRVTLQMTTRYPERVMQAYLNHIHHGISCSEVTGGYSHERMFLLHTVLSSYELLDAIDIIKQADPQIIINELATINFYGRFHRDPE